MKAKQFLEEMESYGLRPMRVFPDGKIRRCWVEGDKPASRNGWFVMGRNRDHCWGIFGSLRAGFQVHWRGEYFEPRTLESTDVAIPPKETLAMQMKLEAIWLGAKAADPDHPYLQAKGIPPLGIRQSGRQLLVPVRDAANELIGLQRIQESGEKRFFAGSRVKGGFMLIGDFEAGTPEILVAEGYATAVSCHLGFRRPVAVCFGTSNMIAAAGSLRLRFPDSLLIYMADEDIIGEAGLIAAMEACALHGNHVMLPVDFEEGDVQSCTDDEEFLAENHSGGGVHGRLQ
jgi:putative DNA primase/helicase